MQSKAWEYQHSLAQRKGVHLERFALLNGAVFSTWHNVRDALSPHFNPSNAARSNEQDLGGSSRGRSSSARRAAAFNPNVRILRPERGETSGVNEW